MQAITVADLVKHDLCGEALEVIREEWGKEIPLTEESLNRAIELGLCLEWFAQEFLSKPAYEEYDRGRCASLAEYEKIRSAAYEEYERIRMAAWEKYLNVQVPAWSGHEKTVGHALLSALLSTTE